MWGETIIKDPLNTDGFEVMKVDGSQSSATFKHLFSNTHYSFVVTAENKFAKGFQHISPKKERTETGKSKNRCFPPLSNQSAL